MAYYDDGEDSGPGFLGTAIWLSVAAGGAYFIWRAVTGMQAAAATGTTSAPANPILTLPNLLSPPAPAVPNSSTNQGMPAGIANNNPGNIMYSAANNWVGQVGQDAGGRVIFDTPADGLRAMFKLLKTYQANIQGSGGIGVFDIQSLSRQWTATQQDAWASNVSSSSGIGLYDQIDPNNQAQMQALANGIVVAENGQTYNGYYAGDMGTAWAMAA